MPIVDDVCNGRCVRPVSWTRTEIKDLNECGPLTFGLVPHNVLIIERSRVTELGGQERSVPPSGPSRRLRLAIGGIVKLDQVLEMAHAAVSTLAGRSAARTSRTLLALFKDPSQDPVEGKRWLRKDAQGISSGREEFG